ncbi:MAG TPA: c-type cytochrome [Terriglobales bacterium]|nr:c-type cytochrome [Terriglobales bacterium]
MKNVFPFRSFFLVLLIGTGFSLTAVPIASAHDEGAMNSEHDHLHHHHNVLEKTPERDRLRVNPLANDPDAIAAGKKLFERHCAVCHGKTAEGRPHKAPNLRKDEVQAATPGAIFWVLTNGVVRHGMPVWSKLPEAQRWQITTYIKSLQPSTKEEHHEGSQ